MSELSVETIKKRNDELDKEVMKKGKTAKKQIIESITKLINDIVELSSNADSFDEYRWLSDTAVKWQSVLSTTFGEPRTMITLAKPKLKWLPSIPPDQSLFSKEEIEIYLNQWADLIKYATLRQHGNETYYRHLAKFIFASEVLNGKINFVKRIDPKLYGLLVLEEIWLKDVKLLTAFFKWTKDPLLFVRHNEDFSDASDHIFSLLVNEGMKAQHEEFNLVKNHLQKKYIDIKMSEDNKSQFSMRQGAELHQLIEKKAYRIFDTTGSTNSDINWIRAETYVKMFYENIIPAIENKEKEKVKRVLEALQYSETNRFFIINCFETALAIYFLDLHIIQELWPESAGKPLPGIT